MLNCCVIHAGCPMVWTFAASVGVGPNAARSRNRRAAADEAFGFWMPICITKGAEVAAPLLTVRFADPDRLAKPLTVRVPAEKLAVSGDPFSRATEVARKPEPVTVVENKPSGNWPPFPTLVITGAGGISVMVAVAVPFGPVAVTASVPEEVIASGAV